MLEINFYHIRSFNGGKREAFEELCCQIFHRLPTGEIPAGSEYCRFRGAGGDGGIEAMWVLPNGEKWGIQAKYFDDLASSQFQQMKDSLQQAVQNHPELKRYIFCIPFDPTGLTAGGRRGRSQKEKLDEWKQAQLQELYARGIELSIEFWTESVLRSRLIAADPEGGMRRYWFDTEIMTNNWLEERLQEARAQAGKRYSPKLSVKVPAFDALEAFACADSWQKNTHKLIDSLHQATDSWHRHMEDVSKLPEEVRDLVQYISSQLPILESELTNAASPEYTFDWRQVISIAACLLDQTTQIEKMLLEDLCSKYGENADTPSFRQFQAEYMCAFPAANLDTTRDLMNCLKQVADWLESPVALLPRSQVMLLKGPAGVGKTHAIVDHALHRSKNGQICIVFFGEDFTDAEPWEVIASKLGLAGNISRDELWGMINAAAEATGQPALIYIDALNESERRQRWKQSWLPFLRQQFDRFPWLKLCVSCRDTYLDEVFDDRTEWPEFEHNGFVGREFDAIRQFFEFYGLEPPATPLMQREFANPLFLHLICQGLKGAGLSSIPLGSLGFTDVLRLVLEDKNQRVAQFCRYDSKDDKVSLSVYALARKMAETKNRLLPRQVAKDIVDAVYPVDDHSRSLFLQLEKEGLISLIERRSRPLGPREWYCRFTFERVADVLVALSLLEQVEPGNIQKEFKEGILAFAACSDEAVNEHRGLLEAWSIILPEKFGVELADIVSNVDRNKLLLPITFSGFQWRTIESFSDRTRELVLEGLAQHESCPAAVDALLGVAVIPEHPLNAEFIDYLLNQNYLTERDPFWCSLLHEDFQKQNAAWRLIEWALKADLTRFSEETARLWALVLGWFCAASDRRVRDRATKGLVRLFLAMPSIIKVTLARFVDIDDDYVLERVSLAAYSAVLRLNNNVVLRELAEAIYFGVFSSDEVPLNALIRDWLRLILELAHRRNLLSERIDPVIFRPPYNSPWPIEFPSEEDVAYLAEQDAFKHEMNLSSYGIGTDFARYILDPHVLNQYDLQATGITESQVHRWFMKSVAELGYPGQNERCYHYDRCLVGKYGGGRGKPVWAERLGKKYYWILLQRLAGIFADNLPEKVDLWDDKGQTSLPKLQGMELRDIDPTDLRAFSPDLQNHAEWWKPIHYDFETVVHLSHDEWMWKEDFPELMEALHVTDNQGELWFHLALCYPLKKVMGSSPDDKYPYRDLATLLNTATVSRADLKSIKKELRSKKFSPYLATYVPHDYQILMGEYPNSLACEQRFETGELRLDCEIPGAQSAKVTTIELLRGANFEYDYSQDESASNLYVPSPDLINFHGLKWDDQFGWLDEAGIVQIMAVDSAKGSGLLIRQSYLREYLQSQSLILVCMGYQEKILVTGDTNGPGIHEVRSVYAFDGDNIALLNKFTQQHRKKLE